MYTKSTAKLSYVSELTETIDSTSIRHFNDLYKHINIMNKILTTFLILFNITVSFSQKWQTSFGSKSFDRANSITILNDEIFVVGEGFHLDKKNAPPNSSRALLVRLDSVGNVKEYKLFDEYKFGRLNSIISTKDNLLISVGNSEVECEDCHNKQTIDGLILCTNNKNEVLWQKTIGSKLSDELNDVIEYKNQFFSVGMADQKGWIILFDKKGNVLFDKKIKKEFLGIYTEFTKIIKGEQDFFYIGGKTNIIKNNITYESSVLLKLDIRLVLF